MPLWYLPTLQKKRRGKSGSGLMRKGFLSGRSAHLTAKSPSRRISHHRLPAVPTERIFRAIYEEVPDEYERRIRVSSYLFILLECLYEAYTRRGAAKYRPPESLAEQMVAR